MSYKGRFKPLNPSKYAGNSSNIIYSSSYELKFMAYLDKHPDVISWASEEMRLPYISPIDNRRHEYYPDFLVRKRNRDRSEETMMIEIKPHSQANPPVQTKGKTKKRFLQEVMTWGVNEAKWKAASALCEHNGWRFCVMTEYELGILF